PTLLAPPTSTRFPYTTLFRSGGDISPQVLESAAAAGLRALFTSEPWLAPRRVHGCWILGRNIVKAATPSARIAALAAFRGWRRRSEEHTSELQSRENLVCRLL